jgi:hypothetical protein
MFDWLFPKSKLKLKDPTPTWEYSEKPVLVDYEKEHRETMAIMEDILKHLDELKILVDELKTKEKEND